MRLLAVLCAALGLCGLPASQAQTILDPGPSYRVGPVLTGPAGRPAQDISGIACPPAHAGASRRCLLVNDEGRSVQFATIGADRMSADGAPFPVIGDAPSPSTVGVPPDRGICRKKPKFDELDGEGVAYDTPFFYVVGSHGCSRGKGKLEVSRFILARLRIDPKGGAPTIETTYRLADALARAPTVEAYFGRALDEKANGLNIEGVAVSGGTLFAGLRAPSVDGKAFIVGVPVAALFAPGSAPLPFDTPIAEMPLALGPHAGIRDLAPLAANRLLVLSGPAQEQKDVHYGLFEIELSGGVVTALGRLAPLSGMDAEGKAEAVTVLGKDRVLVLFDGLPSGAPREYRPKLD